MTPAPLDNHSDNHNSQAKNQNRWEDYIGQDTQVGVFLFRCNFDEKEQAYTDQGSRSNGSADETDVIAKKTWKLVVCYFRLG
jgi:hypothetical protein